MIVTKHTNATHINMIVKTLDGKKHHVLPRNIFETTKENPITHTKFNCTGKEKFKPVNTYKLRP